MRSDVADILARHGLRLMYGTQRMSCSLNFSLPNWNKRSRHIPKPIALAQAFDESDKSLPNGKPFTLNVAENIMGSGGQHIAPDLETVNEIIKAYFAKE
jgi:hypothetical protein